MYMVMRDEKEGRKKQARANQKTSKATQHTQGSNFSKAKCMRTISGLEIKFYYSLPNGLVALICLAHAGMYSVAFMHYWLPDLQYYLPQACGQALNVSPVYL